jgi:hypothetical protein
MSQTDGFGLNLKALFLWMFIGAFAKLRKMPVLPRGNNPATSAGIFAKFDI